MPYFGGGGFFGGGSSGGGGGGGGDYISTSEKGAAYGVATLDANKKLTASQIPDELSGKVIKDTYISGGDINAFRAVYEDGTGKIQLISNTDIAYTDQIVGITTIAGVLNTPIPVVSLGVIENPSWTWEIDKPIFLGNAGELTQVRPVGHNISLVILGFALSLTKMFVKIESPILLA